MLEMLDYTIRIGSTPTFLYFKKCIALGEKHTVHEVQNSVSSINIYFIFKYI